MYICTCTYDLGQMHIWAQHHERSSSRVMYRVFYRYMTFSGPGNSTLAAVWAIAHHDQDLSNGPLPRCQGAMRFQGAKVPRYHGTKACEHLAFALERREGVPRLWGVLSHGIVGVALSVMAVVSLSRLHWCAGACSIEGGCHGIVGVAL